MTQLQFAESDCVGEVYVGLGAAVVVLGVTPHGRRVDLPLSVRRLHRLNLGGITGRAQVQLVTVVRPGPEPRTNTSRG